MLVAWALAQGIQGVDEPPIFYTGFLTFQRFRAHQNNFTSKICVLQVCYEFVLVSLHVKILIYIMLP